MGKVRLIRFRGSQGAERAFEALLAQARTTDPKKAKPIGIAAVVMYTHREYVVLIEGETRNSPTFTRGMLHLLDEELGKLVRGEVLP